MSKAEGEKPPAFVQASPSTVMATLPAGASAAYLTDEDGTIVGYGQAAATPLSLAFKGSPLRLTLHAHFADACRTVHSAPGATWRTVLDEFDYMGSGGVAPNSSRWDEATLRASAPTLQLLPPSSSAGGAMTALQTQLPRRARVSMLQQPGLPVPLLFASCSSASNEPLLLHLFHRGLEAGGSGGHGAHDSMGQAEGGEWWVRSPANFSATFDVPPKCHDLRACAAMPDGEKEGCGGPGPRRCVRLDLLPEIVAGVEAALAPAAPLPAEALLDRRTREGLVLRLSPECQSAAAHGASTPAVLYARFGGAEKLLAFGEGKAKLNVNLPLSARTDGGVVRAYQLCNGTLSLASVEVPAAAPPPPSPVHAPMPVPAPASVVLPLPVVAMAVLPMPGAAALAATTTAATAPSFLSAGMTVGACLGVGTVVLLLLGACLGVWRQPRERDSQEKEALRSDVEEPTPGAFGGVLTRARA